LLLDTVSVRRCRFRHTTDLSDEVGLVTPLRLIHGPNSHDVLLGVEEVRQIAHILTWDLALGTANPSASIPPVMFIEHHGEYSHINRPASILNGFQRLVHVVRVDGYSDGDFPLVGIVGVQAWREVVERLDVAEGAVGGALLEHEDVGDGALFASLGAGGVVRGSYELPSEDVLVELLGPIDIFNGNLSPGDGTGLFMVSRCRKNPGMVGFVW
jgi:hypothetical protein